MDSETTGSIAAGVPEIPAALLRAEDSKGKHAGSQFVTGCLPHSNPLLCTVAATGQTLVLQFRPHLWNRILQDFLPGTNGLACMLLPRSRIATVTTTLCNDIRQMFAEAFGLSEDRMKRDFKGICSHLGRCTNAADTSDANAPGRHRILPMVGGPHFRDAGEIQVIWRIEFRWLRPELLQAHREIT